MYFNIFPLCIFWRNGVAPVYVYLSHLCRPYSNAVCAMNEGHVSWLTCGEQLGLIHGSRIQTLNLRVKLYPNADYRALQCHRWYFPGVLFVNPWLDFHFDPRVRLVGTARFSNSSPRSPCFWFQLKVTGGKNSFKAPGSLDHTLLGSSMLGPQLCKSWRNGVEALFGVSQQYSEHDTARGGCLFKYFPTNNLTHSFATPCIGIGDLELFNQTSGTRVYCLFVSARCSTVWGGRPWQICKQGINKWLLM